VSPLAAVLADKRVVICAGAGGVGKTTVAATIALGLAAEGRRVAVVTIDPARRLAEALGLDTLGNEPSRVDTGRLGDSGLEIKGELSAMMLDSKRTFDELIARLAPDESTREQILRNRVYVHLTGAIAGSQEYAAMSKLFEIERGGDYDAVVLDTPPSRNALDFLDAPQRLLGVLSGRALRLLLAPTGYAARSASVVLAGLRRITGARLLEDLGSFFGLFGGMIDDFRERAVQVDDLLRDPRTGFLIVTSPERAALEEAIFFTGELDRAGMHRSGLIVNRVHPVDALERDSAGTAARLTPALGSALAVKVASAHADVQVLARRDAAAIGSLRCKMHGVRPVCVADRERDVHSLEDLVDLHAALFGRAPAIQPAAER